MWNVGMHDYQRQRILTFLNPDADPLGTGYHILQSRIAIGSGQMWGKGFTEGTQSQLRFLPERHSDFAVAVFGEEWGFVGCVCLITLFSLFLLSIFSTVMQAKDRFGCMLCAGVFFYFSGKSSSISAWWWASCPWSAFLSPSSVTEDRPPS